MWTQNEIWGLAREYHGNRLLRNVSWRNLAFYLPTYMAQFTTTQTLLKRRFKYLKSNLNNVLEMYTANVLFVIFVIFANSNWWLYPYYCHTTFFVMQLSSRCKHLQCTLKIWKPYVCGTCDQNFSHENLKTICMWQMW